ncbi:MAG: hypothetical protein JWP60_1225 [Ramlibacter sp.]|nr:hypothetical protein [Ramlibacter sp.]
MTLALQLPTTGGKLVQYTLSGNAPVRPAKGIKLNRID